jgi:hypothetical protein
MRDVARRERIRSEVEANRVVARTKDAFASALHLLDTAILDLQTG